MDDATAAELKDILEDRIKAHKEVMKRKDLCKTRGPKRCSGKDLKKIQLEAREKLKEIEKTNRYYNKAKEKEKKTKEKKAKRKRKRKKRLQLKF